MRILNYTFSLLFLLFTLQINAQVAIINDPDGYTNVREEPNKKSKIIYKLTDSQVFTTDEVNPKSNWVAVYIPMDTYSMGCDDSREIAGYIHKSRLHWLNESDKYDGADFQFEYELAPLDTTDRRVETTKNGYI